MKRIKTTAEAQALPEIERDYLLPFMPVGLAGDDIAFFVDTDGITKEVVATPDGWAKAKA